MTHLRGPVLAGLPLTYMVVRTAGALVIGFLLWRAGEGVRSLGGQAVSDVGASLFVVATFDPTLRATVGLWWCAALIWVVIWEGRTWIELAGELQPQAGDDLSLTSIGGGVGPWIWQTLGVGPPLAMGFMLVFDALVPGYLTFPTS